ncbi:hypothetical protein HELRODRAFT_175069 [Helobdella robusta]|uniref:Uncharacterized protein n=1 Tax=Helobdella robusta TaxID=6412 RepID=T1F8T1_HELRO|nr:hypothetical protein HELRODRAFT_175069 [Helobdella robusta]ESO01042.1 hypothetical protein HELRODRAFT_175069 [Helobdella robusta]
MHQHSFPWTPANLHLPLNSLNNQPTSIILQLVVVRRLEHLESEQLLDEWFACNMEDGTSNHNSHKCPAQYWYNPSKSCSSPFYNILESIRNMGRDIPDQIKQEKLCCTTISHDFSSSPLGTLQAHVLAVIMTMTMVMTTTTMKMK